MTQEFDQAMALARQGRLSEAEALFVKVSAADPRNLAAHRMAALVRYQQGKFAPALEAIDAATAASPETVEPWVLRGVILHRLGRGEDAVASVNRATALDPADSQAWYNLGVILGDLGRFEEAVASCDRALAVRESPDLWANRAGALLNLKRAEEAVESCNKALAAAPGFIPALCNRGMAYADLKRYGEAVADLDHALAQAPSMVEAWVNRGTVLHELGLFADALASYDRALQVQATNRSAWVNRGDALVGLKRYAEALENFDRALELAPGAAAHVKRAATLHTLGRLSEALAAAGDALRMSADYSPALEIRGRILLEMDRVEEGLESLKRSGGPVHEETEFQRRHDAEQRAYLAAGGGTFTGERLRGSAINPANAGKAAHDWAATAPKIVVIDDLLTPEGLDALRRFCWSAPMWKRPYPGGYLGALPQYGFAAPLLAQIAAELRATFPAVIGDHALRLLWGFKYDSTMKGIAVHADQAAVNVNFWLTPDEANLDPDRGGLVVWNVAAPPDWDAEVYNRDEGRIRAFLKDAGATAVTVPYRANRAVIFDSDLFHETDSFRFKEGYLNRRINLTMLYGRRNSYGT
jgi:tetratricopeptide (TPR) repeat protein